MRLTRRQRKRGPHLPERVKEHPAMSGMAGAVALGALGWGIWQLLKRGR